ncbi:hypothetical protein SRHO_G00306210 [Serrasalmus rhombeus]
MHSLVAIRLLVLVLGLCSLRVAGQGRSTPATCSPLCRCDEDGGADCSGKGLSTVPAGLSAFTYYLRLAGNDLAFIHPEALSGLYQSPHASE